MLTHLVARFLIRIQTLICLSDIVQYSAVRVQYSTVPVRHAGVRGQLLHVALPGPEMECGLQHCVGRRGPLLSVSNTQGSANGPGGRELICRTWN